MIVLIVDDEVSILTTLRQVLEDEGCQVFIADKGDKAIDLIGKLVPDVVFLDIFMPNCDGLDLLSKIKEEYPQQKVIMISGFGNISLAIQAVKKGAVDFIEKPLNLDEILNKLESLRHHDTVIIDQKNDECGEETDLVGKSYTFKELLCQLRRVAPLSYPILLSGEWGTGKSAIAQYIHRASMQSSQPFVTIACSQLGEDDQRKALETAFFHTKGTIYLYHIHALTRENQRLLLGFLQKERAEKDIRLIASTTVSLFHASQRGEFNSVLFSKINVLPFEIPSLRKHQYDVPLLIDRFLALANKDMEKSIILSTSAVRYLRNYEWPGNIAELRNVIIKVVSIAPLKATVLTEQDLISYIGEKQIPLVPEQAFASFTSLKEATQAFERTYLSYLLKKNYNNLDQVSSHLSMSVFQLKNKLLELNIPIK